MLARVSSRLFSKAPACQNLGSKRITVVSKPGSQRFMAIIEVPPAAQSVLMQRLSKQGFLCMNYVGDPNKIAVGFDAAQFVKAMEDAVAAAESEAPTSGEAATPVIGF